MPIALAAAGFVGLVALTGGFKDIAKTLKWIAIIAMIAIAFLVATGKVSLDA